MSATNSNRDVTVIAGLKPYPQLKDSGVPWLAHVPGHWKIVPNRAVFREVKERDHPDDLMLSVTIKGGVVRQQSLLSDSRKKDGSRLEKSAYKFVCPGDIVYNKMRAWQGAVGVSKDYGIVSPAYVVERPGSFAIPKFFHYLLRTPSFAKEAERWSYGITSDMWSLRPEDFRQIYICLPSVEEQAAIVRFLDHFEVRIRSCIRARQKLASLLEEQKQAIMRRAVTCGLDPNVVLAPSGVEWLGAVPKHWEVVRLGRFAKVFNGSTPSRIEPAYWQGGTIPWLSSAKVNESPVASPSELVTEKAVRECSINLVPKGAVIMGLVGQGKTRGKSTILEIEACISQNLAAIIPRRQKLNGEYLVAFLTAFYKQIREFGRGGNQEALNCEIVGNLRVVVPSYEEQTSIVQHLKASFFVQEKVLDRTQKEICLLQEYRTRLITDVITGKLDVRAATIDLTSESNNGQAPDEFEEPEALNEDGEELEEVLV